MQILATGRWSKAEKRWKMLVALRRPVASPATVTPEQRPARAAVLQFRKPPER
jgi:hypothetical protein